MKRWTLSTSVAAVLAAASVFAQPSARPGLPGARPVPPAPDSSASGGSIGGTRVLPPSWVRNNAESNVTATSGYGALTTNRTLEAVGPYDWNGTPSPNEVGLRGVNIEENSNRPCFGIAIFGKLMSAGSVFFPTARETSATFTNRDSVSSPAVWPDASLGALVPIHFVRRSYMGCLSHHTSAAVAAWVARTMPAQSRMAMLGEGVFARGVQVCTTNDNQTGKRRLKGVRLFGATLDRVTGRITALPDKADGDASYELPNCKEWQQKVTCPTDRLATGLVYHANNDGILYGLALKCSALKNDNAP